MKTKFTVILNTLFSNSPKTLKETDAETGFSESTIRRWLRGDTEPTISAFYTLVEAWGGNKQEVEAEIGKVALEQWERANFKTQKELIEEHAAERAASEQRHEEELRLLNDTHCNELVSVQQSFDNALTLLSDRYNENVKYLTTHTTKIERLNDTLTARAARAEEIAQAAQKRAEAAEERATLAEARRDEIEKHRHHVFLGMLVVIAVLAAILAVIVIANVPQLGGGNWEG